MPKVNTRRSMVSVGEEILHTYAGAKSSQIGNTNFYYNREEGNFHPCQKGQYESSTLSNKNGSHKKPGIIQHQQRNLVLLSSIWGVELTEEPRNLKDSREWKMNPQRFKKIVQLGVPRLKTYLQRGFLIKFSSTRYGSWSHSARVRMHSK